MAGNMIPDKLWKAIAERGWLGFGLLGFALALVGGSGKIPQIGEVPDHIVQYVLLGFGLLLIVLAFLAYRFPSQHEDQPTDQRPTPARVSDNFKKNKATYGIKITKPRIKGTLPVPFPLTVRTAQPAYSGIFEGTLKKAPPPGTQIWLFNESSGSGEVAYWPHGRLQITGLKWSLEYLMAMFDERNDIRIIRFFLVGSDGDALVSAFRRINMYHIAKHPGGWEGFTKTTSDIRPISDTIRIKLVKAPTKVVV